MNTDFRVSIGLMSHPKTVKLVRKCGDGAFMCLLKMWGWATQFKPEGDLSGMDNDDIEIIAGWSGEPGTFVSRLAEVGFLDGESGEYSLHDWEEHNPWVAGATVRSEAASKAGKASAAKRAKNSTDVQRDVNGRSTDVQRDVNGRSTDVQRDVNGRSTPSPSPSPSPTTKEEVFQTSVGQCPTPPAPADSISAIGPESSEPDQPPGKTDPIPYRKIIDHLNAQCNCQFKPTSNATKRHIRARWAEGFRLPDFETVIDHKREEWAQDAKMCMFLRPETLFSTKFEGYLQAARNGPPVGAQAAHGSGNGTRRQGTARQQYMQDVGNLLEKTDEIANGGRPMRLGQAIEPLPGVGAQQPDIGKLGGRLGGPAG